MNKDTTEDSESALRHADRDLSKAEEEVHHAEHDLAEAKQHIKDAEKELEEAKKHQHEFTVEVIYNGVTKKFEVKKDELVQHLREHAIRAFGITQNPHLLGLFTSDNRELPDNETLKAAGVHPKEKLILRPSAVRGG